MNNMKKSLFLLFINTFLYGGLEYSMLIKSNIEDYISINKVKCYLQDEHLRLNFIFPYFRSENEIDQYRKDLIKKNTYMIFNSSTGKIFFVNPYEKNYFELPFGRSEFKNENLENYKVEIKKLEKEKLENFICRHIFIKYSYYTNINFKSESRKIYIDEIKEIWFTDDKIFKDVPLNVKTFYCLSGIQQIDSIIFNNLKENERGFPLKISTFRKIRDKSNIKEYYTEITITNIKSYNIHNDFFTIPPEYKKIKLSPNL